MNTDRALIQNTFNHKRITTDGNLLVGTVWPHGQFQVEMLSDGFVCNCKKKMKFECYHIKSVILGILGVNQTHQK